MRCSPSPEHALRSVCAELDVEFVEFNGQADHVHLLVAYPPTLAIPVLAHRLKSRSAYALYREFTASVSAPACEAPLVPVLLRRLLRGAPLTIIKQYIDGQARPL